jgi:hypothetical protein
MPSPRTFTREGERDSLDFFDGMFTFFASVFDVDFFVIITLL